MATTRTRSLGTATNVGGGSPTPEGDYLVQFKDVVLEDSKFSDDGQFHWYFTIKRVMHSPVDDAENFVGEELWGFSSTGLGPKHKARKWVEALIGRTLEDKEEVTIELLSATRAIATVEEETLPDRTTRTKLTALKPYKKASSKQAAPAPEPDDDDEDEDDF